MRDVKWSESKFCDEKGRNVKEMGPGVASTAVLRPGSTDVTRIVAQLLQSPAPGPSRLPRLASGDTRETAAVHGQLWLMEVTGRDGSLTSEGRIQAIETR